jgi:hypothetical protein
MSVTLSLFAGAGAQFFDNNGNVLSGGKIYTYQAGTTTPLATYTTNSESSFHTNPIILDAAGRVPSGGEIWLQLGVGYKFVLRTSTDVLIATYDNIPSSAQPPAANDADSIMYEQGYTVTAGSFVAGKIYRIASVGTTNFTLIGAVNNTVGTHFIATGVGAGTGTAELSQTVETKLREYVSVKDFGAVGNGSTNDTVAIQAAIDSGAARLYFPAGTYIVTALNVVSDQYWYGDGMDATVLSWAQANIASPTYNMLNSTGNLENWSMTDMGLRGCLLQQTTPDGTGQNLAGMRFRAGSIQNILVERCKIYEFGDKTKAAGAAAIIGPVSGNNLAVEDINFVDCVFKDIANVPGVYISANESHCTSAKNIKIDGCSFINTVDYADQNCIYVLTKGDGTTTLFLENVRVTNNTFDLEYGLDACVEINDTKGFVVSNNIFTITGTSNTDPVLIRANSQQGVINANVMNNLGTGCVSHSGVSVVRFTAGDVCKDLIISNNTICNFGDRGVGLSGASDCSIVGNAIVGDSNTVATGLYIVVASNINCESNRVTKATNAVSIGNTCDQVLISNNLFIDCGNGSTGVINSLSTSEPITNLLIKNNAVFDVVAGTLYFASVSAASGTTNKLETNNIPSTLTLNNPSFATSFANQIGDILGVGRPLVALTGTWAQGSVGMSDGQGFTIPGSGLTVSGAAVGDFVLISSDQDVQGVTVTGYVQSANTVYARVQNETGGAITISAGNWYAAVFKKP